MKLLGEGVWCQMEEEVLKDVHQKGVFSKSGQNVPIYFILPPVKSYFVF